MAVAGNAVRRNAKAVASGIGGIVTVGTAAASLIALVPANMLPFAITASTILAAVEVVRTVGVWITRNGPKVADVVDDAEALYDNVVDAFNSLPGRHAAPEDQPAPAPSPGDAPTLQDVVEDVARDVAEHAVGVVVREVGSRIAVPGPA